MKIEKGKCIVKVDTALDPFRYKTRVQLDDGTWQFDLWEVVKREKFFDEEVYDKYINKLKDIIRKYNFKRKPREHQVEMIAKALAFKQYAFFAEMGTGKTQAALNTFEMIDNKYNITALIITPKTVMHSWAKEIEEVSDYQYTIVEGTKKQKIKKLTLPSKLFILNYETIITIDNDNLWRNFDMVILDESSKIKNPKARRTKEIIKVFGECKYKLILSGTPITQSPIDIFTQYEFLNNEYISNKSWYSFRNQYCIMGGYGGYEIIGYQDLDKLKKEISKFAIEMKKEDCVELPDKIYEVRELEMTKELKNQYLQMKNDLIMETEDIQITAQIVLTKLLRLQQILSGVYLKKENPKLEATKELIEEALESNNQIVIWAKYIESIKLLKDAFKKYGVSVIYGEIKNRQEQIDKFQSGENKIFIGQISTGGIGITLTAGNVVIYYENDYSLQDRLQSEARTHRIGQSKVVLYYDIIYKNTMEQEIIKALKDKTSIAEYLVESFKKGIV